jgi:DNA-binding transcriptional ArsR family regulator
MKNLDQTFSALSDPTRRAILARLAQGEASVGELARPFPISLPAISRHLSVLKKARLISNQRQGKQRLCKLHPKGLDEAYKWMDFYRHFWQASFNRLDEFLKNSPQPEAERKSSHTTRQRRLK